MGTAIWCQSGWVRAHRQGEHPGAPLLRLTSGDGWKQTDRPTRTVVLSARWQGIRQQRARSLGLPGLWREGSTSGSSGESQLEMGQKLGKLAAPAHSGNRLAAAGTGQELRLSGWSGIVCVQPPSPRIPPSQ